MSNQSWSIDKALWLESQEVLRYTERHDDEAFIHKNNNWTLKMLRILPNYPQMEFDRQALEKHD